MTTPASMSPPPMSPAEAEAARFAADLIRIDTTNRGGGDGRERPAAEYVAARLAEAGLEPVLLESAPRRATWWPSGFTPLVLPAGYDYYAMFHGTDERIPLSALRAGVRVMDRFLTAATS